jgi:methylthioribose-1-phosphate isomerase
MEIPVLGWLDPPRGPALALLDQTRLPAATSVTVCRDVPALVTAIKRLVVRGAPMLGLAGAYGVALAAYRGDDVAEAASALAAARPTAVNLAWGVGRARAAYERALDAGANHSDPKRLARAAALAEAHSIRAEDAAACAAMAAHGLAFIPQRARVLTHCNTGALVSAGEGTAFGVVRAAHRAGRLRMLWVGETRPLLQGARLTAWEAGQAGMPYSVLVDAAAGSLFARGEVDVVLVGADRISADGCVANKVGTYALAVLARQHGVPFVVVAPASTIDLDTPSGDAITVEHRRPDEVTAFAGRAVAPAGAAAYNPAFDVTPASLVTAIVTERGVVAPPDAGNLRVLCADSRPPAARHAATDAATAIHMER